MNKASIVKVNTDNTYQIDLPSLKLSNVLAHEIGVKNLESGLAVGDLVIASQTNKGEWIILGYIYGQKRK